VEALCDVYCAAVAATKQPAVLPELLRAVVNLFDAHSHPSCLRVLASAVETFAAGASLVSFPLPSPRPSNP
jgi:hypothetical protein